MDHTARPSEMHNKLYNTFKSKLKTYVFKKSSNLYVMYICCDFTFSISAIICKVTFDNQLNWRYRNEQFIIFNFVDIINILCILYLLHVIYIIVYILCVYIARVIYVQYGILYQPPRAIYCVYIARVIYVL